MSVNELPSSNLLTYFQTIARNKTRNKNSSIREFTWATERVNRMLIEYALSFAHYTPESVTTPTNAKFNGVRLTRPICGVSVIRAGESMEFAARSLLPGMPIGKILLQRNRETLTPKFYYESLPDSVASSTVLLFEPMVATGRSLSLAIDRLKDVGVQETSIISVNYLASPQGLEFVQQRHPDCTYVIASIEEALTENGYMLPGIGDFGDRFFSAG
ncbi:Uracil phosphoribosyltransferase [Corynebacterium glaucum]|nr:uracil phosphoribosyltransferase [Corynebacterium glaucum]WJZ08435.1 Uracil phosphoribosyltransferase [Corynebacterium glaucum]